VKIIYEKRLETEDGIIYQECEEEEATHIHHCYNDEENPKPCKREILE
jgi:hypothetical protein